jgi:hypothetical protein
VISAIVISPRLGGAMVRTSDGRTFFAVNALNVRTPPGARVTVVDSGKVKSIVGRDR